MHNLAIEQLRYKYVISGSNNGIFKIHLNVYEVIECDKFSTKVLVKHTMDGKIVKGKTYMDSSYLVNQTLPTLDAARNKLMHEIDTLSNNLNASINHIHSYINKFNEREIS